jgi:hypothetical protein
VTIQRGQLSQSSQIAALIYASEPRLLNFLFGGEELCKAYLLNACQQAQGQFSANYHWVYSKEVNQVQGVCATWLASMPIEFQAGTISAFRDFLSEEQIIHLLAYKEPLDLCFVAPKTEQMCIGHMSVFEKNQRKGIAASLIQHAASEAKDLGLSELVLDVDMSNSAAIECYTNAGFCHASQSKFEATQQTFSRMILRL